MDQAKIGNFICQLRKEKQITQEQLGEQLGVSQRTVSRWETGKNMPDISMLPEICEVLEINIAELLAGERIEGEYLTKENASDLTTGLTEFWAKKQERKNAIKALIALVITLFCMVGLYIYEFNVTADSTAEIEQAIDEYHFNDVMRSDVVEWQMVGNRMFVLYRQTNHPGACGLAQLQKGALGRYRVVSATNVDDPLCFAYKTNGGKKAYLACFCVNQLPQVDTVACYGYRTPYEEESSVIFEAKVTDTPFLYVQPLEKQVSVLPFYTRYFDAQGREISRDTLCDAIGIDRNGVHSGYDSAELGMVYVIEAIILLLGYTFIRYFLTDGKSRHNA